MCCAGALDLDNEVTVWVQGRGSNRRITFGQLAVCLPCDDGIRFPDRAAFVAGSLQAFVGDFRPNLFQRPRCRLVRMPFGVIRSPRHLSRLLQSAGIRPAHGTQTPLQSKEDGAKTRSGDSRIRGIDGSNPPPFTSQSGLADFRAGANNGGFRNRPRLTARADPLSSRPGSLRRDE